MPKSPMTADDSTGSAEPEAPNVLTCPFDIYELASQRCSVDVDSFYRDKP